MSRIGILPVVIPEGVEVSVEGQTVTAKGKLGEQSVRLVDEVAVDKNDSEIVVKPNSNSRFAHNMWATSRSLINNLLTGVSEGFKKRLEVSGVGYRVAMKGSDLSLTVGLSHEVLYPVPEGVTIKCEGQNLVEVSGSDKQQVGQVAAEIKAVRPPEPYKGKGIKYEGERILQKEGKKK